MITKLMNNKYFSFAKSSHFHDFFLYLSYLSSRKAQNEFAFLTRFYATFDVQNFWLNYNSS